MDLNSRMRKWIDLMEHALPPVNREAIMAQLIDSIHSGIYWDTEAKQPNGDPMHNDSKWSMANVWFDDEDAIDLDTSEEFRAKVATWAEERWDEIIKNLEALPLRDGCYAIERHIRVAPGWEPSDGLGIYWSYDLSYGGVDAPWAPEHLREATEIILHGLVKPEHIDWHSTIIANMDWESGWECEVRVIKGSPIMLARYEVNEEETIEVGKVFRA